MNPIYIYVTLYHIIQNLVIINYKIKFFRYRSLILPTIVLLLFLDIIFCINDKGKPVTIPETIKSKIVFSDFQKLPELGKWFAIMFLVRNSVLFYTNTHTGLTQCKIRQLNILGYEPILVIILCLLILIFTIVYQNL